MKIDISEAEHLISIALQAKLVPMVHGSPAVGKSAVVKQVAKKFSLKVIDLRLSQCDPTDLMGFPSIKNERAGYKPMDTFPIEGDTLPEGYQGWLLFLDEFNSAPRAVQAAAYKLVLDRMVGTHHLHKNVAIVCAGNLETDGAIVEEMSTALQSRLVPLEVTISPKGWVKWAQTNGIDHRVTSYIEFRPDNVYMFSPEHSDKTYASPRTWEFVHKLLKVTEINKDTLPLLAGTIGEGVAREFYSFLQLQDKMPKIEQIITAPNTTAVPTEPSIQFALCGAIAANATAGNCAALLDYVNRLPPEFQIVCVRGMLRRNPGIIKAPSFGPWVSKVAAEVV